MANDVGVAIEQLIHPRIDFAAASARADDVFRLVGWRFPDAEPRAIVGQHFQLKRIVGGAQPLAVLGADERTDAARVVAQHAAKRAVSVGGRVGSEGQAVLVCRMSEIVENPTRLDGAAILLRLDPNDAVDIFGEVHHYGDSATLARQAGAASPRQDRRAELARHCNGLHDIFDIVGQHDSDRHLAVIRAIRRIKRPAADPLMAIRSIAWSGMAKPEFDEPIITPFVIPTVLASLWSVLRYPDSWGKAVAGAIRLGGDVDTLGAIVGALMGAKLGASSIPQHLVESVLGRDRLQSLAGRYHALVTRNG